MFDDQQKLQIAETMRYMLEMMKQNKLRSFCIGFTEEAAPGDPLHNVLMGMAGHQEELEAIRDMLTERLETGKPETAH